MHGTQLLASTAPAVQPRFGQASTTASAPGRRQAPLYRARRRQESFRPATSTPLLSRMMAVTRLLLVTQSATLNCTLGTACWDRQGKTVLPHCGLVSTTALASRPQLSLAPPAAPSRPLRLPPRQVLPRMFSLQDLHRQASLPTVTSMRPPPPSRDATTSQSHKESPRRTCTSGTPSWVLTERTAGRRFGSASITALV